jgi:hypothetical protein
VREADPRAPCGRRTGAPARHGGQRRPRPIGVHRAESPCDWRRRLGHGSWTLRARLSALPSAQGVFSGSRGVRPGTATARGTSAQGVPLRGGQHLALRARCVRSWTATAHSPSTVRRRPQHGSDVEGWLTGLAAAAGGPAGAHHRGVHTRARARARTHAHARARAHTHTCTHTRTHTRTLLLSSQGQRYDGSDSDYERKTDRLAGEREVEGRGEGEGEK